MDTPGPALAETSLPGVSLPDLGLLAGARERPGWFDGASQAVLDRAEPVLAAAGLRELEQVTAELLGAELLRVLASESAGMWFDWWFEELASAAAARVREQAAGGAADGGGWRPAWLLLHGLALIGPPELRQAAQSAIGRARRYLPRGQDGREPAWLDHFARVAATGEVWTLRDAYGTRFGVISGLSYPDEEAASVFLFDIDACAFVDLVGGRVFDDMGEAAAAWREGVGEAAAEAVPAAIADAGAVSGLHCLVYCDVGGKLGVRGSETRAMLDNWFRGRRRLHDLAGALKRRRMPLPEQRNLYHDIDPAPMTAEFAGWYRERHGSEADVETATALAFEWLEGALPGTEFAASPHRAAFHRRLIGDWQPDHPVTLAALELLPEWVRWLGERAGLGTGLADRAVAAAAGQPQARPECAGVADDLAAAQDEPLAPAAQEP